MNCPCGSEANYENCCEPFIKGLTLPDTAEKLMRARYSAYVKNQTSYLRATLAPESLKGFDIGNARKWATESEWLGLKIKSTASGGVTDKIGTVEFVASYKQKGQVHDHHEISQFRKNNEGKWYFVSGETVSEDGDSAAAPSKRETVVRELPKIGRNDPCSCGSGKKFKACCLLNQN
jgi:SEC-C motif-containing protein